MILCFPEILGVIFSGRICVNRPDVCAPQTLEISAMLREMNMPSDPVVERIVEQLIREETQQIARERRSAHRQSIIRPVTVSLRSDENIIVHGFTRNISPKGVGLISDLNFVEGGLAVIRIHSLEKTGTRILSECRWTNPFGDGWFCSGWHFLNVARS